MNGDSPAALDLASIRSRFNGLRGVHFWRSLNELAAGSQPVTEPEFTDGDSEWDDGVSRRTFLKLAAASMALAGLNGCTRQPPHEILPYVRQPEFAPPGTALWYASAMTLGGYATGVLVKNSDGHPIKVDGLPGHPACLGGSSVWMQASILDLYDPDRSKAVTAHGEISSWPAFLSEMNQVIQDHQADQGEGLRFLTETVTSPTLEAQLGDWLKRFPGARAHRFEPISRDNARDGARLAFGEPLETHYRFGAAAVIVSLESDFLYTHPQRLRYTHEFTDGRRVSAGASEMNRLYVVESAPSITGSMADHRLPLGGRQIEALAIALAARLGALPQQASAAVPEGKEWAAGAAADLQHSAGKSIVIAGEFQSPLVHALAHLLNDKLGNIGKTVFYTDPAERFEANDVESLRELVTEMRGGAVRTLLILGGNPVYTAPVDFNFAQALEGVSRSVHVGLELNETAARCTWHIPQAHFLESWGDARAFDGTVSLQQPLIAPLYGGKTFYEVLEAGARQRPLRTDFEIVRDYWRAQKRWPDFEKGWREALHEGWIQGSALPEKRAELRIESIRSGVEKRLEEAATGREVLELTFRPDTSVWDGRFANNGWLQEAARPLSKLSWDNAVLISPALAERRRLANEDLIEVRFRGETVRGPVWIAPGQAANSITLHLGYGRERCGRVGVRVGFNAYRLRHSEALWGGEGVELSGRLGKQHLVSTQSHRNLGNPERQIYRLGTWAEFRSSPDFVRRTVEVPRPDETLYHPEEHPYTGYKWGMSIDLTTCIGCNACLVACNAENNIPVVGKTEVDRGREMYWIRIDTYFEGPPDNPRFLHQPVPCMHCEHAPCELVCPVAATVHDREGLNLQVYNRCVGTRFCSNNCPYKVRRFNFFQYADYHTPSLKPMYNPDVTVRWRGVMEKCTYCIQRIAAGRIMAEKQNRRLRDGEVRTACQEACPAQAIVFGDLNAPESQVAKLKRQPLDYPMLGALNTRPRTTYLARLQNPNSELTAQNPA